jgi:hypothetical protein
LYRVNRSTRAALPINGESPAGVYFRATGAVPTEKLNPNVLMMQSAKDRDTDDVADCLSAPKKWCVFA